MRRLAAAAFVAGAIAPALAHAGQVIGAVRDGAGPVAGARVTLFAPDLSVFCETRTDSDGGYGLEAPAGEYRLGVAKRDYEYIEEAALVAAEPLRRDFTLAPEQNPGRWDIIGDTSPAVLDATDIAVLLADGRIFYCHDTTDPIIFDPTDGSKSFPAPSGSAQGCMNGALLEDGRVLLVGGQEGADPGTFRDAVRWVKAYDPATDTWERLADLTHPSGRWYPGMARLADGSAVVMGGGTRPAAARTETAERLDLATMRWQPTGPMLRPSEFTPAALLHTGDVLITWSPPQLYDVSGGVWRATGDFAQPERAWPGHSDHSIVVLEDGRVLAVGIRANIAGNEAMGEIYDPGAERWTPTSSPELLREQAEVTQLPDGRVLVAGGEASGGEPPVPNSLGVVKWTDLFDPAIDRWRRVDDLNRFAEYHAVTVLVPDGRVVTTGGTRIKFRVGPTGNEVEAFSPPYLFRGVRPEIRSISAATLRPGAAVDLEIFPQTRLTSVVLMGAEVATHWVGSGVHRRLALDVEQTGTLARCRLPADPNVLPAGHYLLFAMVDDIPSEARIVLVEAGCRADLTGDGVLDFFDFLAFQDLFVAGDLRADFDGSGVLDFFDFLAFQNEFAAGCP
jgi:hypothetical protein